MPPMVRTGQQEYTAKLRRLELVEQALQTLYEGLANGANIEHAIKACIVLLKAAQAHGKLLSQIFVHRDYPREIDPEQRGTICHVCGQMIGLSTLSAEEPE